MKKIIYAAALLLAGCTIEDPPTTRSASAPTDTAGIKITVEVPDTTHVIHKTF